MFRFDNSSPALTFFVAPDGVVAQLVERLNGIQEVRGSNPLGSTILSQCLSLAVKSGVYSQPESNPGNCVFFGGLTMPIPGTVFIL